MTYLLRTTGTVPIVTITDLKDVAGNDVVYTHPVSNIDLLADYDVDNIRRSADLQTAITAGEIEVLLDGENITNTNALGLGVGKATVATIEFAVNAGTYPITNGIKGTVEVPFDCTIKQVTTTADLPGNIVVDVARATFAGYPTTTSITAAAPPTLTGAVKAQDTTLTGWTTALSQGDILEFNVTSNNNTIQRATVSLRVLR